MGPIPGPANRRSAAGFLRRYCLIDACSGSTKLPRIPCYNSVRAIHAFFIGVSRGSRIVNLSLRDSPLMQLVTLASMGGKSVGSRLENPCVGGSIPPRATKNSVKQNANPRRLALSFLEFAPFTMHDQRIAGMHFL
jgi:hypothetical protein